MTKRIILHVLFTADGRPGRRAVFHPRPANFPRSTAIAAEADAFFFPAPSTSPRRSPNPDASQRFVVEFYLTVTRLSTISICKQQVTNFGYFGEFAPLLFLPAARHTFEEDLIANGRHNLFGKSNRE